MARRKYKSKEWPNDAFAEFEANPDGSLEIETAFRYEGHRGFDRTCVTLSPESARKMLERVGRDLGYTVHLVKADAPDGVS
jgi:hypothetical protein